MKKSNRHLDLPRLASETQQVQALRAGLHAQSSGNKTGVKNRWTRTFAASGKPGGKVQTR
jgi:hypothetical protein